jgi:hypothetical protein
MRFAFQMGIPLTNGIKSANSTQLTTLQARLELNGGREGWLEASTLWSMVQGPSGARDGAHTQAFLTGRIMVI